VVRRGHLIAVVAAFLIGCALLLMADASGVLAEASQRNKQNDCAPAPHCQGPDVLFITNGATYIASASPFPGSPAPNPPLEDTGGPAILLPAAALLLGSAS
jgi:hypothetical protein